MSASKAALLERIRLQLDLLSDFLTYIDMKEYYTIHPRAKELTAVSIIKGNDWLCAVYKHFEDHIHPIWKLLPPANWQRYKKWGDDFSEHREVVMLSKVIPAFKKLMKSDRRPEFWKGKKIDARLHAKDSNSSGDSCKETTDSEHASEDCADND